MCWPAALWAQLAIDATYTPAQLVEEVLTGPGVSVSNIAFNGQPGVQPNAQIAYFSGAQSILGIDAGLVLVTGRAEVAMGPNTTTTASLAVPAGTQLNAEPDLALLMHPAPLRDVAVLTFDLTATGDTLRFRYVFASEEYNAHACSPYNDAFGFFISGPGISGPFQGNARNVALVPGTQVPVAINTVNRGTPGQNGSAAVCNAASPQWQSNAIYFIDNEGNTDPNTTQFDGYTVPFEIKVPVVCGSTYRIKVAIADAVDSNNDSAVFIEAASFSSTVPIALQATVQDPGTDGLALEGCSTLGLRIARSDSTLAEVLTLKTQGLNNAAALLPGLPNTIAMPAGVGTVQLSIPTQHNGVQEGIRTFELQVGKAGACGLDTAIFTAAYTLYDVGPMEVSYTPELWIDCTATATLAVVPQGGNPPYAIVWQPAWLQGFSPQVNPPASTSYQATITDACGLHSETIQLHLEREWFPPLELAVPDTLWFDCTAPVVIAPSIQGGSGDRWYSWQMSGEELSTQPVFSQVMAQAGALTVSVTDRCVPGQYGTTWLLPATNPVSVSLPGDTQGDCLTPIEVLPEVSGGYKPYTYLWLRNGQQVSAEPTFTFTPSLTTRVVLRVTDFCNQVALDTMDVYVQHSPLSVSLPANVSTCPGDPVGITAQATGGFGAYSFQWEPNGATSTTLTFVPLENLQVRVWVTDACGAVATAASQVQLEPVHARFRFDYFSANQVLINESAQGLRYQWTFADGSSSQLYHPTFHPAPALAGPVLLEVSNDAGCTDASLLHFDPPMTVFVPTAFTPDGDGLNDSFKAVGMYVRDFHLMIFERNGRMVFETKDINEGWKGTYQGDFAAPDHLYVWRYTARSWSGAVEQRTGTVTLLR